MKDSCACPKCVELCEKWPCNPSSDEIRKLLDAGHSKDMMIDYFQMKSDSKPVFLLTFAVKGRRKGYAPFYTGPCTFLKKKKCVIHAERPLIARMSFGCLPANKNLEKLHARHLRSWRTRKAQAMVAEWAKEYGLELDKRLIRKPESVWDLFVEAVYA